MLDLYTDGGVIGPNPSAKGGTWAWCQVEGGVRTRTGSGVVTPADIGLPTVTNNLTELLAAVNGLESLPDGWAGTVYTDSFVTLCRIRNAKSKWAGIPAPLVERVAAVRKRLGRYGVVLLGGHPTRADLVAGRRAKDGFPVSPHNVWCDKECGRQAAWFLSRAIVAGG